MRIHSPHLIIRFSLLVLLHGLGANLRAESAERDYVSRKEYEELKQQMLLLKKELDDIKKQNGIAAKTKIAPSAPNAPSATPAHEAKEAMSTTFPGGLEELVPGTSKFHLAGFSDATFTARDGSVSNFSATFNPIFLWELSPKLLFEGRLEIEPSGSGTNVELEYAQLTYLLNDYMTVGVGEFLSPSNVFVERFEALWINKLPDRPLAVYDGILPERSFGAQIRGGIPIGSMRANYAFYVSNGPNLNAFDAARSGTLEFNNFSDNNDDKAFGGRIGFLPLTGVEVGYGFETAKPGTQGSSLAHVRSFLQSVDLNITRSSDLLKGRVDLHGQYAWSDVDRAVYDPTGALGFGPLSFESKRDGGYAQIAYRPTMAPVDFLKNLELIVRWDHLGRAPSGLGVPQEERWTLGLDYWLRPNTALKLAYEWDNPHQQSNTNAFFIQAVTGF
jgi:hypothetical protein